MELIEVCRLPHRPSDVLEMKEAGVDAWDRLDFDLGCIGFAERWEREMKATEWGPESPEEAAARKRRSKWVEKRKRTTAWLMQKLGFNFSEKEEAKVRAKMVEELPPIDPKEWEELDWGNDETEP